MIPKIATNLAVSEKHSSAFHLTAPTESCSISFRWVNQTALEILSWQQQTLAVYRCPIRASFIVVHRFFRVTKEELSLLAHIGHHAVYNTAAAPMTPRFIDCVWPFRGANDELLAGHRSDTMANECAEAFSSAVRSCARVGIAFFFGWTAKKDFIQLTTRSYQPANNTAAVPHLSVCFLPHSHRLLFIYTSC